jgi:hypothetical protein
MSRRAPRAVPLRARCSRRRFPSRPLGAAFRHDGQTTPGGCVSARSAERRRRVARLGDRVLGDVRLASEALSLGHRIRAVILDGVACTRGRINVVLLELVRLRPIELLRSRIKRAAVVAAARERASDSRFAK